ncbi:hypothetical protein J6590_082298 [Homalodisca vitripennis]|nr:hypothetical protein J6590_082298 [Homalodisca vitripennis]
MLCDQGLDSAVQVAECCDNYVLTNHRRSFSSLDVHNTESILRGAPDRLDCCIPITLNVSKLTSDQTKNHEQVEASACFQLRGTVAMKAAGRIMSDWGVNGVQSSAISRFNKALH